MKARLLRWVAGINRAGILGVAAFVVVVTFVGVIVIVAMVLVGAGVRALASGSTSARPVYGGALRLEIGGERGDAEIVPLVYETLVRIDARGDVQPLLAETWERDASLRRWKFHLRARVKFQDGTPLGPQNSVAALVNAEEDWRVTATSDGLQIETPAPSPDLPVTLAQQKYALIRRVKEGTGGGGTGPFKIDSWEAGKHAALSANLEYWAGRPFVDSLDVVMGRAARERLIDLQVGKADVIEVPAELARRAGDEKIRVETTQAVELLAVVFSPGRGVGENVRLREAVSRAIDRAGIVNLVLQKQGELAVGLLPQWISGTEFLFADAGGAAGDAAGARGLVKGIAPAPALVLGYDSGDALEQAVAERIAVNAREAGIAVSVTSIAASDVGVGAGAAATRAARAKFDARVIRVSVDSPLARPALAGLLAEFSGALGKMDTSLPDGASATEIYTREKSVIESYRVVPIAHLPRVYGVGARVRNWAIPPGAAMNGLPLADVWMEREAQ